jgi:hypothetical protein
MSKYYSSIHLEVGKTRINNVEKRKISCRYRKSKHDPSTALSVSCCYTHCTVPAPKLKRRKKVSQLDVFRLEIITAVNVKMGRRAI